MGVLQVVCTATSGPGDPAGLQGLQGHLWLQCNYPGMHPDTVRTVRRLKARKHRPAACGAVLLDFDLLTVCPVTTCRQVAGACSGFHTSNNKNAVDVAAP